MTPDEITWLASRSVLAFNESLRDSIGAEDYASARDATRERLVRYFDTQPTCIGEAGGVSPVAGAQRSGEKVLKVRVQLPGRGTNRGLRMYVVVNCAERRVLVHRVEWRRDA